MVLNGIKQVLVGSQTEQVPSNIQAKEYRYYSCASVNNTNGIHYFFVDDQKANSSLGNTNIYNVDKYINIYQIDR